MSPRRNRPRGTAPLRAARDEPGGRYGLEHTEEWRGEEWVVRQIAGTAAAKHYRCPGCDQEIPPGVPHVVAWERYGPVDDRRHWHRACWRARDRRTARVRRSRSAPRY
ncbi:ATP/GTP-binding protein [Streptomyces sp. TP-A0874]|uniref:ATP/GTP-binding protein n=1 Tax=Streptomyces sp. TP-A0874 TaxID=549819 RepID=UPI0008536C21|nr:ATP/GTP-binding protein [Streptomyces sp. TP-A0874]